MGFFVHSNTLEIRVINLRGQYSLKIQKFIQRNSKIAITIYLCNVTYIQIIIKKKEKDLPRPGFEPAIFQSEGECANHYTMAP